MAKKRLANSEVVRELHREYTDGPDEIRVSSITEVHFVFHFTSDEITVTSAGSNRSAHFCQIRWRTSVNALVDDGADLVHYLLTNW